MLEHLNGAIAERGCNSIARSYFLNYGNSLPSNLWYVNSRTRQLPLAAIFVYILVVSLSVSNNQIRHHLKTLKQG